MSTTSGVTGADELSAVNRAVGYLIEQGHDVEAASPELGRQAATAGSTILVYAGHLLRR